MSSKAILSLGILLAAMALVSSGVMATESTGTAKDTYNEVAIKDMINEASGEGDKWFWWWPYFGFGKGWHLASEKGGYFDNMGEKINVDDAYQLRYTPSKGEKANMVAIKDMTNEASEDGEKYLDGKWFWWPGWKWWKGFGYGHDYRLAGRKGGYFDKMNVEGASATKPLN